MNALCQVDMKAFIYHDVLNYNETVTPEIYPEDTLLPTGSTIRVS